MFGIGTEWILGCMHRKMGESSIESNYFVFHFIRNESDADFDEVVPLGHHQSVSVLLFNAQIISPA